MTSNSDGNTARIFNLDEYRESSNTNSSFTTEIISSIFDDPRFEVNIKRVVEGNIAETLASMLANMDYGSIDDPFDPIYIYDLKQDPVPPVTNFANYKNIEDRSDFILFDDDLDD